MPRPPSRHSAAAWIAKADEDIDAASLCLGTGERMSNVAAFHTQQAAEKLLEGLIAMAGIEPPHVHDLAELHDLVTDAAPESGGHSDAIETITSWAVLTRYPARGDTPPPTSGEIGDVLSLVKQLRALVAQAASR